MHALGQALLELDQYVANHQPLDSNSSEFRKVRKRFSNSIANAAKHSKTSFGEPWGVLAMDFASNSQDSAIGVIAANPVNLQIKR